MCRVALHADDFGLNPAVNGGIVRGFDSGLLTSTALLTNANHAGEAIAAWRLLQARWAAGTLDSAATRARLDDPALPFDLGVHLNLTQGRPLTGERFPPRLLDGQGRFPGVARLYARLQRGGRACAEAIRAELAAQIGFAVDHGLRPSHVNGHQYIETMPAIARLLPELLARFGICVVRVAVEPALLSTTARGTRPFSWPLALVKRYYARRLREQLEGQTVAFPAQFFGTAHAGRVDAPLLKKFLRHAPRTGLIEIGLHPSLHCARRLPANELDGWHDPLERLRPRELGLLESASLADLLRERQLTLGRLAGLRAA